MDSTQVIRVLRRWWQGHQESGTGGPFLQPEEAIERQCGHFHAATLYRLLPAHEFNQVRSAQRARSYEGIERVANPTAARRSCRVGRARYSITLSARWSTDGGIVSLSALAVFRLMTSSNLVGCSTGRSAGLGTFNIFSP